MSKTDLDTCQCVFCFDSVPHKSDCNYHNGEFMTDEGCTCGVDAMEEAFFGALAGKDAAYLFRTLRSIKREKRQKEMMELAAPQQSTSPDGSAE